MADLATAPKYGMGGSKRRDESLEKSKEVPGPGQYTHKGLLGSASEGKSFGIKLKSKEHSLNPGPGHYNASNVDLRQNPQYKMGTGKREF